MIDFNTVIVKNNARPFIKWAGGKVQLLEEIENKLPESIKKTRKIQKYVEPFIGGGALFFYLSSRYHIEESIINDVNPELYLCYSVIKNKVDELIKDLRLIEREYHKLDLEQQKNYFYQIRKTFNNNLPLFNFQELNEKSVKRVCQFIFLNKTCFNGLYRQNSCNVSVKTSNWITENFKCPSPTQN